MTIIIAAFFSAALTIFINYCIGKPGSKEFSPYEIFSSYTVWLSIKRLQKVDLYPQYIAEYNDNIDRAMTKSEIISITNDFKKMLYEAADPFFTWERAVGMCSICFGVWVSFAVSLAVYFVFAINILAIIGIVLTSHILIRILNKFL